MAINGVHMFGDKELQRMLMSLGERTQRKVLRPAVSASANPVLKSARQKAKKRSGLLRKSLGKKVVTNKKTGAVTAIVGPRRNVQRIVDGKLHKPSRIAHLIEKGWIDEHGNHHSPQAFLRPALEENAQAALSSMQSKLAAGIVKEAAKGGAS